MANETDEQEQLMELVEEQSDVIKDMAVTQNALITLLINKGVLTGAELEETRKEILKEIDS